MILGEVGNEHRLAQRAEDVRAFEEILMIDLVAATNKHVS